MSEWIIRRVWGIEYAGALTAGPSVPSLVLVSTSHLNTLPFGQFSKRRFVHLEDRLKLGVAQVELLLLRIRPIGTPASELFQRVRGTATGLHWGLSQRSLDRWCLTYRGLDAWSRGLGRSRHFDHRLFGLVYVYLLVFVLVYFLVYFLAFVLVFGNRSLGLVLFTVVVLDGFSSGMVNTVACVLW